MYPSEANIFHKKKIVTFGNLKLVLQIYTSLYGICMSARYILFINTGSEMFVCFESLCPSQQVFSHVRTVLPGLNQYYTTKQRIKCPSQGYYTVPPVSLTEHLPLYKLI